MSYFQWNGNVYPIPQGWDGLSIEDWFYRYEGVRDHLMRADEEDLQPVYDEDGDPLDPGEVLLIRWYGFRDSGHWEAFRSWSVASWAAHVGQNPTDLEYRLGGIARERITQEKAGATTDASGAIATAYGSAFAGASQGQYGAHAAQAAVAGAGGNVGAEPIPFERFVEIQEAMGAAAGRGHDASAVLAHFGMSALDWSNVGMYWNKRIQQEAMMYHELYAHYSELYRAKYAG